MYIEKNAHEILLVAGDVWRAGYPMNPVGAFSNAPGVYNDHFGRYIFKRHGYRNNILLLDGDIENIKLPYFGCFRGKYNWQAERLYIPWVPEYAIRLFMASWFFVSHPKSLRKILMNHEQGVTAWSG